MNNTLVCPQCEHYDKIEKVSSIVKSQTRTRENTEWVFETHTDKNGKERTLSYPQSYDVIEFTDLAKRLSPPGRPQARSFSGCLVFLGGLLIFIAILSFLAVQSFFMLLIYLIPGIIIFLAKSNHDTKERARVEKEEPPWIDAMGIWDRLYYCHRDDIVFIPNGKWVASSQINNLLYESEVPT